jgi:putative phosphoesterase
MKIAIFSDSHDNVPNTEKALKWINKNKIKLIIHCGDLSAPSMLSKVIAPNFKGEVHFVHGNVGDKELLKEVAKKFKKFKIHGNAGKIIINKKTIGFTHFPWLAEKMAKTGKGKYDLIFFGHTHKPWEYKIGQCRLVNPGTLAGMFYKATFATYDTETDKLELKILERL